MRIRILSLLTCLLLLTGCAASPAPAAVNRDFDQGRFQALKEG